MSPHPYDAFDLFAPVSGIVIEADRGSLPFHLIHGESLVATAAWAAGEAGIDLLDRTVEWEVVIDRGDVVVLHDPLCPMTPPEFLRRCAERCAAEDAVVVGVRPVTDTLKRVDGEMVGATLDREAFVAVCSPVVLPPSIVADLLGEGGSLPSTDFVELVVALRDRYGAQRMAYAEAPAQARRVASDADIEVLAALTGPD